VHGSEDELTLQYLGIRLFNAGAASAKLALSGYYQKAFHQRSHPEKLHLLGAEPCILLFRAAEIWDLLCVSAPLAQTSLLTGLFHYKRPLTANKQLL
jgi:hypothetical protein